MNEYVQVVSAMHGRGYPIHAAWHNGNGWRSLCGVGARGLMPLRPTEFPTTTIPYRLWREGDELHCERCEQTFKRIHP